MDGFDLIIVPDEEDEDAALVFVDGAVDGRPYRFLLDTGAARTCLQADDYTSAFAGTGTSSSSGLFAAGVPAEVIVVPRIELGPIAQENVPVARVAATGSVTGSLIGMDLLKDHCCHFLFDERHVLVDPPDDPGVDSTQTLVLDKTNHPYLDVRFGDTIASAVWDSGAGITVADLGFIRRHPAYFREVGRSHGTDATGATMQTPTFVMEATTIGVWALPPHAVAGVDLSRVNATIEMPMDLVLGYSTLSQANWWFDFPRRRWAVTRLLDRE